MHIILGKIPWNKGKTGIYSLETIEKIRKANLGKTTSFETKMKIRDSIIKLFKSKNLDYKEPTYEDNDFRHRHSMTRRIRMLKNGGYHTKQQWEYLKVAHNFTCVICGRKEPEIRITKDHIISLKNGGSNDISNIQPLCKSCNSRKR